MLSQTWHELPVHLASPGEQNGLAKNGAHLAAGNSPSTWPFPHLHPPVPWLLGRYGGIEKTGAMAFGVFFFNVFLKYVFFHQISRFPSFPSPNSATAVESREGLGRKGSTELTNITISLTLVKSHGKTCTLHLLTHGCHCDKPILLSMPALRLFLPHRCPLLFSETSSFFRHKVRMLHSAAVPLAFSKHCKAGSIISVQDFLSRCSGFACTVWSSVSC